MKRDPLEEMETAWEAFMAFLGFLGFIVTMIFGLTIFYLAEHA